MLGRRAREEGCAWVCRARVAVRREVRAVAGKRGLPRGRAPGFMCNEAAEFPFYVTRLSSICHRDSGYVDSYERDASVSRTISVVLPGFSMPTTTTRILAMRTVLETRSGSIYLV